MATATRSNNEPMSNIVLWTPKHGRRKPGRPAITYTDILKIDTGLESADFKSAMGDRKAWGTIVVRGHHSTYKHTDRNVELKTKGSFQNHPNSLPQTFPYRFSTMQSFKSYYTGVIFHSGSSDLHPWWQMDLGDRHCLGRITITLSTYCCGNNITIFILMFYIDTGEL